MGHQRDDAVSDLPPPAYYAARRGGAGGWRDWWTLLHLPYTAWHLANVVLGAAVASRFDAGRLVATLAAFLLAVGVSAHALDELHGRPLRTGIPSVALGAAAAAALAGAVALGGAGVVEVGPGLLPFILVGALLVVGYNLELLGGRLHTTVGFAAAWGAFPVLTGAYAQAERVEIPALAAAGAAFAFACAQRLLSNPARTLRRRVRHVEARVVLADGRERVWGRDELLAPLEAALRALVWAMVALAAALLLARLA